MKNNVVLVDMKLKKVKQSLEFSSKADTLEFFYKRIKKSKIEKLICMTVKEWYKNQNSILSKINQNFSGKIIVRSSARGEDSLDASQAGKFKTIFNIKSTEKNEIKNAVNQIINSYITKGKDDELNQVLIQKQTLNSKTSGVIFTKTPDNGSPYYVINYEDGSSTDSVTKGMVGNTIKIHNQCKRNKIPAKWKKLILAIKEIEDISNNDKLDIEFAITKNNIIIFQVRPLTALKKDTDVIVKKHVRNEIEKNQKKFLKIQSKKYTVGKKTIFSNMADWNPAEIIGSNPKKLDYSLYDYLVMKDSWSKGRTLLGYNDEQNNSLMEEFSGRPYVNVETSFSSLLPYTMNRKIQKKLINYFMKKLENNPHLHDKVEFEILFTCFDFTLKKRTKELIDYGFTRTEIKIINDQLIDFTNELIKNTPHILKQTDSSLKILNDKRKNSKKKINGYKSKFSNAETLLKNCKRYGIIQFAAVARLAFIANILLKGLTDISNIKKSEIDKFMNSISTPVTEFQNDLFNLKMKKITKAEFLDKYGHLRPGTYDITIERYDKMPELLEDLKLLHIKKPLKAKKTQRKDLQNIIKKSGLIFKKIDFFDFIRSTINLRERTKFEFTKSLSDAIELIADGGNEIGLTREELANLSLDDILKYKTKKKKELKKLWKKKSALNQKNFQINEYVQLPPIIFSENDFTIIHHYIAEPNYITKKKVISNTILLDDLKQIRNIDSNIVLIENADPGFDWIFAKNPSGLITKYGGVASHMAIRCAELGLPAAIGCGEILFNKLKMSSKINLNCNDKDILILEYNVKKDYSEEKKILKSLGYIR